MPSSTADLVDAFIAAFDAGDEGAVARLMPNAPGADGGGIVAELRQWSPWTSLIRADLDGDPVAVIWVPEDQSHQHQANDPQPVGYVSFHVADGSIADATIHRSVPQGLDHKADSGTLVSTEPTNDEGADPAEADD